MRKLLLFFNFILFLFPINLAQAIDCSKGFADLAERLIPAVVNISTEQKVNADEERHYRQRFPHGSLFDDFRDLFEKLEPFMDRPEPRDIISLGSGFIIDESGVIVTSYHVIANSKEVTVTLSDNTQVKAKILGKDAKTDLAVLKVDIDQKLPYVEFGDSDKVRVGDWVLAIGNPFGLGGSVSTGIVSARSRDINIGTASDFIQTDAAINRGNSGGPLFDINGKVIGINTAIFSPSGSAGGNVGIGFSIPSNSAEPIIQILSKGKKVEHGWIGVKVQLMTKEAAESLGLPGVYGVLVAEVTKNSPAEKAGVLPGDVILEFNGEKIKKMQVLLKLVSRSGVNKKIRTKLYRNGKTFDPIIVVGKLQNDDKNADKLDEVEEDDDQINVDSLVGLKVTNLTNEIKNSEGAENIQGIIVTKVDNNAFSKGIRKGDIIESVNQVKISNVKEFYEQINIAKRGKKNYVLLLINHRDGNTMLIPIKLRYNK